MVFKSNEIKKLFKQKFNLEVRVRTVKVKSPFVQICPIFNNALPYELQSKVPNVARVCAMKAIYGDKTPEELNIINVDDIEYGNIRANGLSFSEVQYKKFVEIVTSMI